MLWILLRFQRNRIKQTYKNKHSKSSVYFFLILRLSSPYIPLSIASYLHHSVPDEGPLADEMSYMPDMIDNLTKTLIKSSPKLENATLDLAEKMASNLDLSKYQSALNTRIIDSTKTVFTTPQIVFNVQELDEAKLQQCFNYINRKFGSKYPL